MIFIFLPPLFERHGECAALTGRADHIQAALVLFDDLTGDRETKPDAAEEIVAAAFEVIKTIEDARQVFLSDADSLILDGNQNPGVILAQVDLHVAALRAELDRVIHQCHERPLEGLGVAPDRRQVWAGGESQADTMILGIGRILTNDRVADLVHVHFLEIRQDEIHFLEEEDIVDQRHDLLDVARDRVDPRRQLFALQDPSSAGSAGFHWQPCRGVRSSWAILDRNSRRARSCSASF